jgi:hypothetical protein
MYLMERLHLQLLGVEDFIHFQVAVYLVVF